MIVWEIPKQQKPNTNQTFKGGLTPYQDKKNKKSPYVDVG